MNRKESDMWSMTETSVSHTPEAKGEKMGGSMKDPVSWGLSKTTTGNVSNPRNRYRISLEVVAEDPAQAVGLALDHVKDSTLTVEHLGPEYQSYNG